MARKKKRAGLWANIHAKRKRRRVNNANAISMYLLCKVCS